MRCLKALFLSLVVVCTAMPCSVSAGVGRSLDVFTQKGGTGFGSPGGIFELFEVVNLTANLTYNNYPVQHVVVAFIVKKPNGELYFIGSATTDSVGLATVSFRIRMLPECLGMWAVVASADIACVVASDSLTFEVTYSSPPHGPEAWFTENKEIIWLFEEVEFDASDSMLGWDGFHILPITEYRWDFGDGNKTVTNTTVIHHAYNESGIYYVTLVVYAPGANPETSTSSPQQKVVLEPQVGGYSIPMTEPKEGKPLASYITLLAICIVSLAAIRRKTRASALAIRSRRGRKATN